MPLELRMLILSLLGGSVCVVGGWLVWTKSCVCVCVCVQVGEHSSTVASTVTAGLGMYGRAEFVIRRRKWIACVDSQDL